MVESVIGQIEQNLNVCIEEIQDGQTVVSNFEISRLRSTAQSCVLNNVSS